MDLQQATKMLRDGAYTCVLCRGEKTLTSRRRGVAPLMEFWQTYGQLSGYSAADKVVGKGAALLYCLLGIRAVYAQVISSAALQVLQDRGIAVCYDRLTDAIQNRAGDGPCPIEAATRDINDPADAPDAIRAALQKLRAP